MRVVFAGENFGKRGQARSHRNRIGIVSAAVEDLVLRIRSITDVWAPNAASGNPPPIDFARQIMSGVTP